MWSVWVWDSGQCQHEDSSQEPHSPTLPLQSWGLQEDVQICRWSPKPRQILTRGGLQATTHSELCLCILCIVGFSFRLKAHCVIFMYFRIMNLYNCPLALNEIGVKQEPCSIRSQQRPLFRCFPYIYNSANYGRVAPAMSGTLYAALSDLCGQLTVCVQCSSDQTGTKQGPNWKKFRSDPLGLTTDKQTDRAQV